MGKKHRVWKKEEETKTPVKVYGVAANANTKQWGEDQQKVEKVTCSLIGKPDIFFSLRVKYKIKLLMKEFTTKEWIGYLVGEETKEGDYLMEDLVIPPHEEASYSSATAVPFNIPDGCIGVIHSHHVMRAFHSGTDESHVDRNFPVSITVAKGTEDKLEYSAVSGKTTDCGKYVVVEAEVKYLSPEPDFDEGEWLKAAKENVDKGTKVYGVAATDKTSQPSGQVWQHGYGYAHMQCGYQHGMGQFDRQAIAQQEEKKEGWGDKDKTSTVVSKKMIEKLSKKVFDSCNGLILTRTQLINILEKNPMAYMEEEKMDMGVWSP